MYIFDIGWQSLGMFLWSTFNFQNKTIERFKSFQNVTACAIFPPVCAGVPAEHRSLPLQKQVLRPRPVDRRLPPGPPPVLAQRTGSEAGPLWADPEQASQPEGGAGEAGVLSFLLVFAAHHLWGTGERSAWLYSSVNTFALFVLKYVTWPWARDNWSFWPLGGSIRLWKQLGNIILIRLM